MKKWGRRFWTDHGDRLVFAAIATSFGIAFFCLPDMRGEGKTLLVGVAMLAFNKARGTSQPTMKEVKDASATSAQ
ncbi:MAG: hypothetical protein AB1568_04665 [Thermodesulfobacteriota bacterium]